MELSQEWNLDVQEYLLRNGWTKRLEVPGYQAELVKAKFRPVLIPLNPEFGDFFDQGVKVLSSISHSVEKSPTDILYESMLTRFDIIELKHPSTDTIGIPLAQAECAVSAFIDSFQTTARHTNSQLPSFGHKRDSLNSLLKSEARLGHTQKGSFIFRIIVPIQKPLIEVPNEDSDFLPRKSTLNYANSVKHTKEAVESRQAKDLEQIVAPFVDRIRIIAGSAQESAPVMLSTSFSRYDPIPGSATAKSSASFSKGDVQSLENIVTTLKARSKDAPNVLIGFVYKLRSFRKINSENIASIRAPLPDGRVRTFNIHLTANQYEIAVRAHRETAYVRVSTSSPIIGSKIVYPDSLTIVQSDLFANP